MPNMLNMQLNSILKWLGIASTIVGVTFWVYKKELCSYWYISIDPKWRKEMEIQKQEFINKHGEIVEESEMGFYAGVQDDVKSVYRFAFKATDKSKWNVDYWVSEKLQGHKVCCVGIVQNGTDFLANYSDDQVLMLCTVSEKDHFERIPDEEFPQFPRFTK